MKNIVIACEYSALLSIAVFCGFMLCIYTSHLPYWKQMSPENFLDWFSTYSGGISKGTGPLGMLSLALPLITLILTWSNSNSRMHWLFSFLLVLGVIVITMIFFVKTNTSFMNKTIAFEAVPNTLDIWERLHLLRIVMTFLAAVSAVIGTIRYQS